MHVIPPSFAAAVDKTVTVHALRRTSSVQAAQRRLILYPSRSAAGPGPGDLPLTPRVSEVEAHSSSNRADAASAERGTAGHGEAGHGGCGAAFRDDGDGRIRREREGDGPKGQAAAGVTSSAPRIRPGIVLQCAFYSTSARLFMSSFALNHSCAHAGYVLRMLSDHSSQLDCSKQLAIA